MKIINANAQYLDPNGLHPYSFMEKVGRICYKSEDKITDTSATKFILGLFKNKHTAMLEHAHIILKMNKEEIVTLSKTLNDVISYKSSKETNVPYLHITINDKNDDNGNYLSGSFRTFINLLDTNVNDLTIIHNNIQTILSQNYPEIFTTPINHDGSTGDIVLLSRNEFINDAKNAYKSKDDYNAVISKHLVHTVLFTCDRGVTHEFVRHRPASFSQESTRYCNYSNAKFGEEITVIKPCFYEENSYLYELWKQGCENDEYIYFELLKNGAIAQQGRDNLPTSLKTELVITATENEWQHIINLRYHGTTGAPHPQMKEVMEIAYPSLVTESEQRLS